MSTPRKRRKKAQKAATIPAWSKFEKLIGWIQTVLHRQATVTVGEKLIDHTSGERRQVDITLRYNDGPLGLLVIVEARNRSRRIDPEYVDAVVNKRRSVGADAAMIVSSNGFSLPARKKAATESVRLMSFNEATKEDWSGWASVRTIDVINRKYENARLTVFGAGETDQSLDICPSLLASANQDPSALVVNTEDGRPHISLNDLVNQVVNHFGDAPFAELVPGGPPRRGAIVMNEGGIQPPLFLLNASGVRQRVGRVVVEADFFVFHEAFPLRMFRYKAPDSPHSAAELLVGEITIAGKQMRIELLAEGGGEHLVGGSSLVLRTTPHP